MELLTPILLGLLNSVEGNAITLIIGVVIFFLIRQISCKIDDNAKASKTAHSGLKADVKVLTDKTNSQGEDIAYIKGKLEGKEEAGG